MRESGLKATALTGSVLTGCLLPVSRKEEPFPPRSHIRTTPTPPATRKRAAGSGLKDSDIHEP
jgi:hypothetical protein